jgi:purine nucleosidase
MSTNRRTGTACNNWSSAVTDFPRHDDDWYRARLALPTGRPRVVIDTDTANEIDDQFALAWALMSHAQFDLLGVYAAPFSFAHRRNALPNAPADAPPFNPPAVGMERSYEEIRTVFDKLGIASAGRVFRGSAGYLPRPGEPMRSEAVDHLIECARQGDGTQPLYVLALGCVTNIASALLLAPELVDRIVVVWTSGYPSHAPHVNDSFNLEQDLTASQLLLESGVPHVYLPDYHVGAQLRLSLAEMERYVQGRGAIGDYLHRLFIDNPLRAVLGRPRHVAHSWVIWDVINVAWLLQPDWVPSTLVRTPSLTAGRRWRAAPGNHLMREAHGVNRDAIFGDFFTKLDALGS